MRPVDLTMRPEAFRTLLGLRYRLLWAYARTSSGRVALLLVAYILALGLFVAIGLGGVAAGMAAVQAGQASRVATIVLGLVFLNALLTALLLGFGLADAFSDATLRRYPLSFAERLVLRHVTAVVDPVWLFTLALYLGFALALSSLGAARAWVAIPAALLLLLANYLLARVLAVLFSRLLATRAGPFVAAAGVTLLSTLPALVRIAAGPRGAARVVGRVVLAVSPPSAAASAMSGLTVLGISWGVLRLAAWVVVLAGAVAWLESRPERTQRHARGAIAWESPWDRVASVAGPQLAPLVGKMLRYYARNSHFRYNYPFMLPLMILFVAMIGGDPRGAGYFAAAVGVVGFAGLSGGVISLNAFGYDGAGFRRYYLLPVAPGSVVRAAALVSLLPGLSLLLPELALWVMLSPVPSDTRMVGTLLSAGLASIFLFPALGVWTSVLAPRPSSMALTFNVRRSWPAHAVLLVGIFTVLFLPGVLGTLAGDALPDWWWVFLAAAGAAAVFFFLSVRIGGRTFDRDRERLIATMERQE